MKKGSQKQEKILRENSARYILRFLFPEKYDKTRLSDRPDIVSYTLGCEVTHSLIPSIFEITAKEPSLFNGKYNHIKEKILEMVEKSDKDLSTVESIHEYERIYLQKLKNLNSKGYQLFEENNLFIFSWLYEEKAVLHFLEFLENTSRGYVYQFDYIYLFFDQVLMEIDDAKGEYRIFPLEEKEQRRVLRKSAWEVRIKKMLSIPFL